MEDTPDALDEQTESLAVQLAREGVDEPKALAAAIQAEQSSPVNQLLEQIDVMELLEQVSSIAKMAGEVQPARATDGGVRESEPREEGQSDVEGVWRGEGRVRHSNPDVVDEEGFSLTDYVDGEKIEDVDETAEEGQTDE